MTVKRWVLGVEYGSPDEKGDWCAYSDVAPLEVEIERLRKELEDCRAKLAELSENPD